MAPLLEAPVPGSVRPFDPTAYTSKGKAAGATAAPTSDEPPNDAKAHENSDVQTLTDSESTPKAQSDQGVLKQPGADADPAGASRSSVSTESPAEGTCDKAVMIASAMDDTKRLVSLRIIKKIYKVQLDDKQYALAEVDGWTCKIPPHLFREGQLVLYFQVDSFLPGADGRFGKGLGKSRKLQMFDGKLGHRIKTEKFGSGEDKIVSQGMIMQPQDFPEIWKTLERVRQFLSYGEMERNVKMIDLTLLVMYRDRNWAEVLGVKKWEEPAAVSANNQPEHQRLGKYPGEVFQRTDVTRVEDCPNLFAKDKYKKMVYQESVKMDGAAMVVYFVKKSCAYFDSLNPLPEKVGPNTVLEGAQGARFGVCSNKIDKNELEESNGFMYWETALRHDLPAKLSKLGLNIAIQGELCGGPIQSNREGLPEGRQEFFVYAMYDIDKQNFINPRVVEEMAKDLGLEHVPVLGYVRLPDMATSHEDLRTRAARRKGEGLVFKCLNDGRRFKVMSHTYLLEHDT